MLTFPAHWLAVEGVQPSIPQNPSSQDSRSLELLPKGPNANPNIAAQSGNENTTTKPNVKHILSKELQLYFEKVCTSVLDEAQEEYRSAGLASLKDDPGLHQLVPYFIQFVAEKVTHSLKDLFILTQMMNVTEALVRNQSLFIDPYVGFSGPKIMINTLITAQVASMVPPVLTCLIGRNLGTNTVPLDHFELRDLAASVLGLLCKKYSKSSHNLKPRLARSCLKNFLDPGKPFGTHYGSILGLHAIGGPEVVRALIIPNLKDYDTILKDELLSSGPRRTEAEKVLSAIMNVLLSLVDESIPAVNGHTDEAAADLQKNLVSKIGEIVGNRIAESGHVELARAVLESG